MPDIPETASAPGHDLARARPPDPDRAALAARSRQIRHDAGVGFRQMWRWLGVNPSTLHKWETEGPPPLGRSPKADTWMAVTRLLDVTNGTGSATWPGHGALNSPAPGGRRRPGHMPGPPGSGAVPAGHRSPR